MKNPASNLLVGYGGLVAVLGLLSERIAPDLARPAMYAGLAGGGLSALWGVLALLGKPHRGWAILTLAGAGFVLLSQAVTHGMPSGEAKPGSGALSLLAAAMLLATLGTLMAVAHIGLTGPASGREERGPSPKREPPASAPAAAESWKDARRQRNPVSGERSS